MVPHQRSLFAASEPAIDRSASIERIQLDPTAWVEVARGWLRGADVVLDALVTTVDWKRGRRFMYDHVVDDPRLSRSYRGSDELPHPVLSMAKCALESRYHVRFGGLGLNYYRDGNDSVAFHRDRELRYLDNTLIAIVTLGSNRPFLVRPKSGGPSRDISPSSGDLLVMGGSCQVEWLHAVPKVARACPRISATWRWSARTGRPEMGPSARAPRRYDVSR